VSTLKRNVLISFGAWRGASRGRIKAGTEQHVLGDLHIASGTVANVGDPWTRR